MKSMKLILIAATVYICVQLLTLRSYAYIDPSAVTFSIQIIVGIVVAAGATVGIIVTKLKKNVKNKLGINLEKKKETEDDLVIMDNATESDDTQSDQVERRIK